MKIDYPKEPLPSNFKFVERDEILQKLQGCIVFQRGANPVAKQEDKYQELYRRVMNARYINQEDINKDGTFVQFYNFQSLAATWATICKANPRPMEFTKWIATNKAESLIHPERMKWCSDNLTLTYDKEKIPVYLTCDPEEIYNHYSKKGHFNSCFSGNTSSIRNIIEKHRNIAVIKYLKEDDVAARSWVFLSADKKMLAIEARYGSIPWHDLAYAIAAHSKMPVAVYTGHPSEPDDVLVNLIPEDYYNGTGTNVPRQFYAKCYTVQ